MKQTITRYCTVASLIIILLSFNADSMIVHFLLAGEVPGTSLVLSPTTMLLIIGLLAILPFGVMAFKEHGAKLERQITAAKKRFPKRRYSSVS